MGTTFNLFLFNFVLENLQDDILRNAYVSLCFVIPIVSFHEQFYPNWLTDPNPFI